jgi:threonine/homoserine efflux transporter RhtA
MMIPVVGVFSSMLILGEHPVPTDWVALVLVIAALITAVVPRPRSPA